jgi:hypothetical protein
MSPTNVSKYISVGKAAVVVVVVDVDVVVDVVVVVGGKVVVLVVVVVGGKVVVLVVVVVVGGKVVVLVVVLVVDVVVVVGGKTFTPCLFKQPLAKFSRYISLTSSSTLTLTPNNNDALVALFGVAATRVSSLTVL